jgi:hypothetical protein
LSANSFPELSERYSAGISDIFQRDDGLFQIGLDDDAAGPFRTRDFAAAVVAKEVRDVGTA